MISSWMEREGRLWALGSLALVSILFLTACGASQSSSAPAPAEDTATTIPSPAPTATPPPKETFPYTEVWHFANQSDYTYEMTIALGDPTRIPESGILSHPRDSDFTVDSACTVDPKLDVVIPAFWSAKATTVGFDTPIGMRALFAGGGAGTLNGEYTGRGVTPSENDGRILVAQSFSDGPKCSQFSSENNWGYGGYGGFSVQWGDPVPEESVRTSELFIVIKNYFSPATPQGDRQLLDWIVLRPFPGGDLNNAAMVFRDVNGTNVTTGSLKGITLSGEIVDASIPTPTPAPTLVPSPTPAAKAFSPKIGDSAVIYTEITLRSREYIQGTHGTNGSVLPPKTVVTLIRGPERSIGGGIWWEVRVDETSETGWVQQTDMERNPDAPPTPTALPTQVPTFSVGDSVTTFSSTTFYERAVSSRLIGVLDAGTVLTVTDGPYYDKRSGDVTWQITVDTTGQVGYVRQDLIEPVAGDG